MSEGSGPVVDLEHARLIREGEAAAKLYKTRSGEIRMMIYPMVRGLYAARATYPSDKLFGQWLQKSEYSDINKDDRAALIELGRYPKQEFLQYLGHTSLNSPQLMVRELKTEQESKSGSYDKSVAAPINKILPKAKQGAHPNQSDMFCDDCAEPMRFSNKSFDFEHDGVKYNCAYGVNVNMGPVEIDLRCLTPQKLDQELWKEIDQDAKLITINLQHGVPLEVMQRTISRNEDGSPSSPLGAVIDSLCAMFLK